ncbi:MAG: D-2-hydroxyacid dehydrogenase [Bifidobacteriaceae bacterium]|nr:D-2-hydroxyacid dehydrogenase [Bifidobacteriaceae bacterium]
MLIVTTDTLSGEQIKEMKEACPEGTVIRQTNETNPDMSLLRQADIVVGFFTPQAIHQCTGLKWLQLTVVGFEKYVEPGVIPADVVITNAHGAFGQEVSEFMFAVLLSLMKKLELYRDNQNKHVWHDEGMVRTLDGARVVVVGAGDIGTHFARLCTAMGAHCIGFRRHVPDVLPAGFEEILTMDSLDATIRSADVVASFLPYSPETTGLFDASFFASMKTGSYFLNGGRGNSVVLDDLSDTLEKGHLAGAGLDVFDVEPLPANNRLWSMPTAIITPHVAGNIRGDFHLKAAAETTTKLVCQNLRRWFAGKPLINVVRAPQN